MYQYIVQISWPSPNRGSFGWMIEDFISEEWLNKSQIIKLIQNERIKFELSSQLYMVKLSLPESFPFHRRVICETENYVGNLIIHKLD